jgi:2-polyprenyl-3-methyl-5-hydroxy-6-metoxy-1,4-benzoquinol methylase
MIIELKQLDSRIPKWDFTCFKERNCPICNTHNEDPCYVRPDNCNVVRCTKCSCYFVSPCPSESHLTDFYQNYHKNHFGSGIDKNVETLRWECENSYTVDDPRLIFLKKDMEIAQSSSYRVLDFGCGTGSFLYQAKLAGANIRGIELDESAVSICHQLGLVSVENGGIESLDSINDKFNLIVLNDVIEHPLNPGILIAQLANLLTEAGKIMIWTPNGDEIESDKDKVTLRVDLEHMQYLTSGAIKELCYQSNLEVFHYAQLGYPTEVNFIHRQKTNDFKFGAKSILVRVVKYFGLERNIKQLLKYIRISTAENRAPNGNYHLFTILRNSREKR